jgi:hypothetical protein
LDGEGVTKWHLLFVGEIHLFLTLRYDFFVFNIKIKTLPHSNQEGEGFKAPDTQRHRTNYFLMQQLTIFAVFENETITHYPDELLQAIFPQAVPPRRTFSLKNNNTDGRTGIRHTDPVRGILLLQLRWLLS